MNDCQQPARGRQAPPIARRPDVFELSDGNFAVIGTEATEALERELPADA
ncbi:hypothetical protein [Streptomyces sp. SID5910]|nr:hypothetical protein [Streptomyces sp. SID5910]MYR40881.1 hypothetical protein [Streptomyces sp. SID5910]